MHEAEQLYLDEEVLTGLPDKVLHCLHSDGIVVR